MKIHHPAILGVALALFSAPVASQVGGMEAPSAIPCVSHDNCPPDNYCASDNVCEPQGGCATVTDCTRPENTGYMLAACVGTRTCTQRMCGIDCNGEPLPPQPTACFSNDDCHSTQYCASDGVCERMGGCAVVDDCFNAENVGWPVAACMGEMQCDNRSCGMRCTGSDALYACDEDNKCPFGFCNTYGFCTDFGGCIEDEDCANPDNLYDQIYCLGTTFCNNDAQCETVCDGGEAIKPDVLPETCASNDECPIDSYCAGNSKCLKFGYCDRIADCTAEGHDIFFPACLGTISCENEQCAKTCDEAVPIFTEKEDGDNGAPVEVNVISCVTDTDCNTNALTANTRSAFPGEEMYCAAGVCSKPGTCVSDEDCMNPSNFYFDKKCMGYVFCNGEGLCDRECGVMCKNGSKFAECLANPCDTLPENCGHTSCVIDACDNECGTILFDAMGNVMPGCISDLLREDPVDVNFVPPPESEDPNETQINRFGSSAVRATSIFAILAAVLAAVIV